MTATASSITATAMDRTAALFIVSLISSVMYHADRSEEKRYSQAEGGVEQAVVNGSACRRQATSSERKGKPGQPMSHFLVVTPRRDNIDLVGRRLMVHHQCGRSQCRRSQCGRSFGPVGRCTSR